MNDQELRIKALLLQGKTYKEIQEIENVSPTTISAVRKKTDVEDNKDEEFYNSILEDDSADADPDVSDLSNPIYEREKTEENIPSYQGLHYSEPEKSPQGIQSRSPTDGEIELEKLKAEFAHKETMEKLRLKSEALNLRETDLKVKQEEIDQKNSEKERRKIVLDHRYFKLMQRCKEGFWRYSILKKFISDAAALLHDYEEYDLQYKTNIRNGMEIVALRGMRRNFRNTLKGMRKGGTQKIAFTRDLKKHLAKYHY